MLNEGTPPLSKLGRGSFLGYKETLNTHKIKNTQIKKKKILKNSKGGGLLL